MNEEYYEMLENVDIDNKAYQIIKHLMQTVDSLKRRVDALEAKNRVRG